MRKIVDSNFLQSEGLREYLAKSPNNYAVITDYAAIEAYKGDTLNSIFKSMEILSDFPNQVLILKSTTKICGLKGRKSGLQRRLIDFRATQEFPGYCRNLLKAKEGNLNLQNQLLEFGEKATDQVQKIHIDASEMPEIFEMIAGTFTGQELKELRTGLEGPDEFKDGILDKFIKNVQLCSAQLFRDHPEVNKIPTWKELPFTFIFRHTLCAHLWCLNWISVGGAKNVKTEKLRNDMIDLIFAAYATYFDGFLTNDRKAMKTYQDALAFLSVITRED